MESTKETEREQMSSIWGPLAAYSFLLLVAGCLVGRYAQDGKMGGVVAAGFILFVCLVTIVWAILHRKHELPIN